MRMPPQRSSRSNTAASATSSGKKIPSTTGSTVSSSRKRKLLPDTSSGSKKTSSISDASTTNKNIKRKQSTSTKRKYLHLKKTEPVVASKLLRPVNATKKSQSRKSKIVPLVGVKKIKIKEGKVTVKNILITAGTMKSQKNRMRPLVKPMKKHLNTNTKNMIGNPSSSGNDCLPAPSTTEDQVPGTSCDTGDQKKAQNKIQFPSKLSVKKTKTIKKCKSASLTPVPVPFTRTKKFQQQHKLKPTNKVSLKQIPVTRNIVISQEVQHYPNVHNLEKKKKILTRRKQSSDENNANYLESNIVSHKGNQSPTHHQNESVSDNLESTKSVISVIMQSSDNKVSSKKTKDEESAISKLSKIKSVKKKPKIEGAGKGNAVGIAFTYSEVLTQPTKDKIGSLIMTPKRDGKDGVTAKSSALKKTHKTKISGVQPTKSRSTKNSTVLKPLKVIATKIKKITSSRKPPALKSNKKPQQPKKRISKSSIKQLPQKADVTDGADSNVKNSLKSAENNDADSSTSDEITLDVLLIRQQQMKQEIVTNDEQKVVSVCSNISLSSNCSSKMQSTELSECKQSLPLITSVKVESNSSRSDIAASSPSSINSSDDEDLRSIKNRIKVKLEGNSLDNEEKKHENCTKRKLSTKLKSGHGNGNRGKNEVITIKKELIKQEKSEKKKIAASNQSSSDQNKQNTRKSYGVKHSQSGVKRSRGDKNSGSGSDTEQRARRMKLFGFWSGPKRHRVASLNALAKVHCLYENESRGALLGYCGSSANSSRRATKPTPSKQNVSSEVNVTTTRILRSAPGLRGMGKHWDMHNASSTSSSSLSSDENDSNSDSASAPQELLPSYRQKKQKIASTSSASIKKKCKQIKNMKKVVKRRRNRCELMMDLKDMVVRKRMASLNASAILAASYSVEKRTPKNKDDAGLEGDLSNVHQMKKKKKQVITKKVLQVEEDSSSGSSDIEVEESDLEGRGSSRSVIEVRTTPSGGSNSNKKVAVIVNQDTDVTITGVYVNSTTRSTHHEGFCSIAGMQYRISSTSHTQTEATAVATETVLHTSTAAEHPPSVEPPMKSYTPLGALSNMQPPGSAVPPSHLHHHPHAHPHPHTHPPPCNVPPQQPPRAGSINPGDSISPLGRRHGCTSAFSAPPPPSSAGYGPQPPLHHPPPQGQSDPAYIHGYYQPAGPLISAHHHRHSSSTSGNNTGKVPPVVLSTLEGSPNPTPPPSATSHSGPASTTTATPQQIVSSGGTRSGGDESSDNDVIITASSCSGSGEVAPPPPVPQPLPLQHPHQVSYRYPQTYPPTPTPSTPQHMHHQSYVYNYPHTQYYPSPPASASIQYSAVATNPQHHTHYHNQDLCYSGTANYPPAYFHHKSYSTPPPAPYHRRYVPHPAQYYPSDLYSNPVANASQQNSSQSQQSQQMVVTGSIAGSASSYQPSTAPPAPPPPSLVGVSSNPPPPPTLVDTYPPPVSIVDPYPPPPGYYTGYSAGPGAAGCYSHSPPTRSLAFIDAAYQSCPCPMQSCPKNVHTGPLTGDGKGPHIAGKQQQQPVQDSGASFHQLPLPPVALALPLEPPGALGPPSPARGSAGMPPPPSPATASARNPNHTEEQVEEGVAFQQRLWDTVNTESQSEIEVKSKQELSGEIKLTSLEVTEDFHTKEGSDFKNETTTLSVDEALGKTDMRHTLLAISKVSNPDSVLCRKKSNKISPSIPNNVHLLMCGVNLKKKRQNSSEAAVTKSDKTTIVDPRSVKSEVCSAKKEESIQNKTSDEIQNGKKSVFRNIMYRKRKLNPDKNKFCEIETEISVPKIHKFSNSSAVRLSIPNEEAQKLNGVCATQHPVANIPLKAQLMCKKSQPLSSNGCSMHNVKHTVRKRKLNDAKCLAENKEPMSVPAKKKIVGIHRLQNKVYPSRVKKNVILDSVVTKERTNSQPLVVKKFITLHEDAVGKKVTDHKKATKINGVFSQQKKPSLRHQSNKSQQTAVSCPKTRIIETSAHVESKKIQQCKKTRELGTARNKYKVSHMLRSHGLRESLSEFEHSFSDDAEPNRHRRKARRTSIGSKKEQCRRNNSVFKNEPASSRHILKKQAPQHQDKSLLKKTLQLPRWSNGWKFEGEPFESKVFLSSDDMLMTRKCYPLMRHEEGDVICPRDCILLKSGPRKTDLPFVAKVAALWENPDDGEMMMSLLWYYRPEHTDQGRRTDDMEDEIFASKHKDINSVACIEDKCYVLTFNEYCRYRKCVRRLEEGVKEPGLVVPQYSEYPRENKQPPGCVAPELVFFCRRVYDFRQRRILKNPG